MRTSREDANVTEALEDRLGKPSRERRGEEGVCGREGRGPGLEAAVSEVRPARKGDGVDLQLYKRSAMV